jgi:hypothetical protein
MSRRLVAAVAVPPLLVQEVVQEVVQEDIAQNTLPLSLQSAIPMRSAQVVL